MAKKSKVKPLALARMESFALVDTRVIYCGDNLEHLVKISLDNDRRRYDPMGVT
jgi:hypothetical protein